MELFFSSEFSGGFCTLTPDDSQHCVKVLRHREGDSISVIDGKGTFFKCSLTDANPKAALARIDEEIRNWGTHPYKLTMAVCPTKNIDRYEWFAEKATEFGIDAIAPVIGDHSERKVLKTERLEKILISAAKQSLKASVPSVCEPVPVSDFISAMAGRDVLKLIAYCFEDESRPRVSIKDVLSSSDCREVAVLIGPEGDFSVKEAQQAISAGFIPVTLGPSRLRTETAALASVSAVYFRFL